VTEPLKLADQPLRVRFAKAAPISDVVVLSELLVGHFALKQLVADHHDGVSHRYRLLRATPPSDTSVVRREVAPLGTRRRVGRFGQRAPETLRSLTSLSHPAIAVS